MARKIRLDLLLLDLDLATSRQRAQALIAAGKVLVDEVPVTKARAQVPPDATVRVKAPDHPYVSRGGLKLAAALDTFDLGVEDLVVLDIGASTGGFTDCVLQRGARHVIAVDVGYGQLAWSLRQDPRVTCMERCNARRLTAAQVREALKNDSGWPPDMATMDVSFISLTKVLPAVKNVLGPGKPVVALVKPQFEAGRRDVGKGGVVRDPEARERAICKVLDWATAAGFEVLGRVDSTVPGPKGNVEALAWLTTPAQEE